MAGGPRPTIVAMNNFYRNMAGTSEKARRVNPHRSFAHQLDFSNPDKVKRQVNATTNYGLGRVGTLLDDR